MYPDEFPWTRRPGWLDVPSAVRAKHMVSRVSPEVSCNLPARARIDPRLPTKMGALRDALTDMRRHGLHTCDPAVAFDRSNLARDYLADIRLDVDAGIASAKDDDLETYVAIRHELDDVEAYLSMFPRKFRGACDCSRSRR